MKRYLKTNYPAPVSIVAQAGRMVASECDIQSQNRCGHQGPVRRYLAMRVRISTKDLAPFDSPKASHANEQGSEFAYANTPPPTMKFRGA